MSKNIFIAGTGTDVGKTFVSGLIVKKLFESGCNVGYFKTAVSGNDIGVDGRLIPGDAVHVKTVSGVSQPLEQMCPYVYETAVSPHLAAKIEGNPVDMNVVRKRFEQVCTDYDYVTVEGSGGIICPLRFDEKQLFLEDIIKEFDLSCILVADAGLGTINSVVLTVEYMRSKNITVKGIVFNRFNKGDIMHEDNLKMCEYLTGVKVIACVEEHSNEIDIEPDFLKSLYE